MRFFGKEAAQRSAFRSNHKSKYRELRIAMAEECLKSIDDARDDRRTQTIIFRLKGRNKLFKLMTTSIFVI